MITFVLGSGKSVMEAEMDALTLSDDYEANDLSGGSDYTHYNTMRFINLKYFYRLTKFSIII